MRAHCLEAQILDLKNQLAILQCIHLERGVWTSSITVLAGDCIGHGGETEELGSEVGLIELRLQDRVGEKVEAGEAFKLRSGGGIRKE